MYQSELFGKTLREAPHEEESKNAILLSRGGYIMKNMSGVYTYLPLGLMVLENLKRIIREEMNKLPNTQEVLMPVLQSLDLWIETGRLEGIKEVMYRLKDEELGLGPTHEETATDIFRRSISSYKELPKAIYQIQSKFRNEPRAKSGLLRGREFLMKDLYSFHLTEESMEEYYLEAQKAYARIYDRCKLKALLTEASGGVFSQYSHEYQVICEAGEDLIYLRADGAQAKNKEIVPNETDPEIIKYCGGEIKTASAVEAGNIFRLYKKYSAPMQAVVDTESGERCEVWMACYGLGVSRLLGIVVEIFGQIEEGKAVIKWPEELAPYKIHILDLTPDKVGEQYYKELVKKGESVLYDDREVSAGEKFSDADLIGSPTRVIISKKSIEKGGLEVVNLETGEQSILPYSFK